MNKNQRKEMVGLPMMLDHLNFCRVKLSTIASSKLVTKTSKTTLFVDV